MFRLSLPIHCLADLLVPGLPATSGKTKGIPIRLSVPFRTAKEVKRLQVEAPTKEELSGIQNYEAGIFVLQNSTPAGIINQLNFLDLYGLDDSYLNNYVKNIYAVTPAMVSQTVRNYVQYDKMTKVMIGDKEAIQRQVDKQKATPRTF